ncbi:DUF4142 domain-containing protein [Rhodovibrionaceae bacterium A322]
MLRKLTIGSLFALIFSLPVLALSSTPSKAGGPLDDPAIFAIYNQVNSFDIETALLAQINGQSPEVQALAEMVARDHTGVRKAAYDLATELGVTPLLPSARFDAAKSHYTVLADLQSKSGADFDKAYLRHEIAFHTAAIEAVETLLLPAAKRPELKAHFQAVLPHFKHHLAESQRVAALLGAVN